MTKRSSKTDSQSPQPRKTVKSARAHRDPSLDPPALVCIVGKTKLSYHLRAIEDLHEMLKKHGDWMLLGNADEQKFVNEGSVEAWARLLDNPVGDSVCVCSR